MNLTSKQVKTFFKRYSKETGVRFVNASPLRRLLNRALRRVQDKYMKILDPMFDRAFCPKCVKPGLAIVSFEPGCESNSQVTLCQENQCILTQVFTQDAPASWPLDWA